MAKPPRQVPVSGKPQVISDLLQKGLALHQSGRVNEAAAVYLDVLRLDAAQPAANNLLGLVRLAQGKAEEAVTLISRATEGNPADPQYFCNLGVALNAARGQFLERQAVAFAQFAQLCSEKMAFAQQRRHGGTWAGMRGHDARICEINNVKFL